MGQIHIRNGNRCSACKADSRVDHPGTSCCTCKARDRKRAYRNGTPPEYVYDPGVNVWQIDPCPGLTAALAEAERDLAEAG